MKHFIRLDELRLEDDNRLVYTFSSSLDVFAKKSFFIEYDRALEPFTDSLAAVPFAAVMAPVAWAAGAELVMPSLDGEYAQSLERCSAYFRKHFPKWSFDAPLRASLVWNESAPKKRAILFSGGVDSLAAYVCHKDSRPLLYTIFGADIPLTEKKFIQLCKEKFDEFTSKENTSIRYIFTDVRDILNLKRLRTYAKSWYAEVAHGLMLSSLIAPAASDSVKTLSIASCSHRPGAVYSCGSEKELVREIRWSGTSIESANHDLNRYEKIRNYLKDGRHYYPYLRVCWMQFKSLNCSRCEKCLRTICELLINNIDPALCNFIIDDSTLPALKKRILSQYYMFYRGENALDFWRTIQESIRLDEIEDLYGSVEFFRWFAGFEKIQRRQNPLLLHAFAVVIRWRMLAAHWLKPAKTAYEHWVEQGGFSSLKEDALKKVQI